ncbi:SDR family oxidoreductase [Chloroflexota bacterium]
MKKVIVTGGAGFIGSHLAEKLAGQNYHVIILDNLLTGKLENIDELVGKKNVDFNQGSITDLPLLQKLFQEAEFVFHLAALTSVPASIEDPLTTNEINVTGTLNVLIAARDNSVRKVVLASSCAIYGDAPTSPQKENTPPNPISPYASTKLAGEYYSHLFRRIYGLTTVCLRYFNVYGPRQDSQSQYAAVIPAFIGRVVQGLPPVIFGDGEQSRDFVFIEDITQGTISAAQSDAEGTCNLGSGKSTSVNQLAQGILRLTQKSLQPIHAESRPGDSRQSMADISRAQSFGYKPEWSLEAGLKKVIAEFKNKAR